MAFCVSLIIFLSIGFILFAIQADAILKSTFKSVMGRQFLEDDIPGLLLLIDFEKAFDTVEWSFIEKKHCNFTVLDHLFKNG
jgi:hypothetical protein